MLKTDLFDKSLTASTNVYASISVLAHLKRLYHIVSWTKGCVPYEGEFIVKCVSPNKTMYVPEAAVQRCF